MENTKILQTTLIDWYFMLQLVLLISNNEKIYNIINNNKKCI